ncbi:Tripartite tricarboxylate transporter TctA family protein [Marinobacterium lutimaris]|uniref:Tripartite tricarboxylate transporter TctA family protein n=1 Tax=Marinobacterium lutimaris TaxID=568106 RepID=A0A1H6DRF3_9GAMM|nr:Tripartite tricarboxylate transporter TctA family protein [Marinobacterium lutimaris]
MQRPFNSNTQLALFEQGLGIELLWVSRADAERGATVELPLMRLRLWIGLSAVVLIQCVLQARIGPRKNGLGELRSGCLATCLRSGCTNCSREVSSDGYGYERTRPRLFAGPYLRHPLVHGIGALPVLASVVSISICLLFTLSMDAVTNITRLLGVYGGAISAILINSPGTPHSAVTILYGYPMARLNEAGKALG